MKNCVIIFSLLAALGFSAFAETKLLSPANELAARASVTVDAAVDEVVRQNRAADAAWSGLKSEAEVVAHRDRIRERMIEAIGGFPERCDLDVRVLGTVDLKDCRVEKLLFASRPNHHVTAHLFLPRKGKAPYPAILMPCGHDFKGKLSRNHQRAALVAAREGFAALLCDPIDQGERIQHASHPEGCVHAHVNAGLRAHLLGWNLAQFRIWDCMRGIDVLESRTDIDRTRIGVAGMSGGGTLSAYLFLLDGRIKAACPMGFLTDMASLAKGRGPQDSEQIVFGQLAFGLNHLSFMVGGYPRPICPGFTYDDFFPYAGSRKTFADAESLYGRFGHSRQIDRLECPGRHGWYESEKLGQVLWMRRWLCNDETALPFDRESLNALNVRQGADDLDYALAETPEGKNLSAGVMALPNERSVYDILSDEADRLSRLRNPLTREAVRKILGEPLAVPAGLSRDESLRQGYWFRRGGEDEQTAALLAWLGRNYVANRVADLVAEAEAYQAAHEGRRMILKAAGEEVVAAAHARFLRPELFESIEISNPPPSWRAALKDPSLRLDFRTIVYGALKAYDWPDLLTKE